MRSIFKTAYEVKCNPSLLILIKKNGVFLFGISSFVLKIFTFPCYANEKTNDVKNCSWTSQQKQNNTRYTVAMTTVLLLVLCWLRLTLPVFVLTKYHPLPTIYWEELRQYWHHVCSAEKDLLSHPGSAANGDTWFLTESGLKPRENKAI